MIIKQLKTISSTSKKTKKTVKMFEQLLLNICERGLNDKTVNYINTAIDEINVIPQEETKRITKVIRTKQNSIIKLLEKEHNLVPKSYYQNMWLAMGMVVFGVPLGVVLSLLIENMAFIGVGLPIGLSIGIAIGSVKDNKAAKEGRQLNIVIE